MEAVTIHDMKPLGGGRVLAVDLIDLLRLLEPEVRALSWICQDVWCMGDGAGEFHRKAEAGIAVDGAELLRLASSVYQVIQGDFIGKHLGDPRPCLVLIAEDSTYYVVASSEPSLLERVRQRFSDVQASTECAEHCVQT